MRRRLLGLLTVGLVATALVAGAGTPGGAGGDVTLTIEKVVDGEVPPGSIFVVDLNCEDPPDVGGIQITFDDRGDAVPPGSNQLMWTSIPSGGADCTPTEQAVTQITASYACTATGLVDCSEPGPQVAPVVVHLGGTGDATVTVTNTPVPPPEPAQPVELGPTFTG